MKIKASYFCKKGLSLLLIFAVTFSGSVFCLSFQRQKNKTEEKNQKHSFPFTVAHNKTILLAKIGESRPLKLILDSGMGWDGMLIMNSNLKDSINLVNPKSANIGGAGKGSVSTAVFADSMSFSIGDVEFNNQRIVVLQNSGFKGSSNDGVVGYSILGHYAVEVNFDNSTINLHDPENLIVDSSWEVLPILLKENNIPWVEAKIVVENETPVSLSCYIDCASSEAIELLQKPEQKFSTPKETKDVYLGRGLSGDIYGKTGNVAKVIFGSFELKNVVVALAPAEVRSKQKGSDAVISNNLLRRFNLIFDYAHLKLYIKPNSHFNDPF